MSEWQFLDIGYISFVEFLNIQNFVWKGVTNGDIENTIIFAEHPATISINQSHIKENLSFLRTPTKNLDKMNIPIVPVKRGGGIAVHGPGILGCYVVAKNASVAGMTFLLEKWIFTAMSGSGINLDLYPSASSVPFLSKKELHKYRGFWYNDKKIGTEGLHFSKAISQFGVNINVCPDPALLSLIHPCGITEYELGSLAQTKEKDWCTNGVKRILRNHLHILKNS